MPYITITQIKSRIPNDTLVEALDDNNDGVIDDEIWAEVQADADNAVDSILGQRFEVPFTDPAAIVIDAARIFTLEILYERRGCHTEETNPWKKRANQFRTKLTAIAKSDEPLKAEAKGRGRVKIVSEPSVTQSKYGNLST